MRGLAKLEYEDALNYETGRFGDSSSIPIIANNKINKFFVEIVLVY